MASAFEISVIQVMTCLVADQKAKLIDGEGHTWTAKCVILDKEYPNIIYTTVNKDAEQVYSELYDCDKNLKKVVRDMLGIEGRKEVA